MNTQIAKDNALDLHNLLNRNCENLVDFSLGLSFSRTKTKFPKRVGKLWTYTFFNRAKAELDYILMNKYHSKL